MYFKIGQATCSCSLKAIGDVTGVPGDIIGDMYGIGTTSIASNGLFFKTEAGAVQYDQFKITGVGGSSAD